MKLYEFELHTPPIQPEPPRCLSSSEMHYRLGIISPSAMIVCDEPEAIKYHKDKHAWKIDTVRYAVYRRTATRDQWKWLHGTLRADNRPETTDEDLERFSFKLARVVAGICGKANKTLKLA